MRKFYYLTYKDVNQDVLVGVIEHTSEANRDYVYMLSPRPHLSQVVGQDYVTNLFHFAWLLNAFNDHHIEPEKFGIPDPMAWWHQHDGDYRNSIITIDDHFRINAVETNDDDTIVSLYNDKVSNRKRNLLSNLDVR